MKLQQRTDGKFLLVLTNKERTKLMHALFEASNLLPEVASSQASDLDADLRRRGKAAALVLTKTVHIVQDRPT